MISSSSFVSAIAARLASLAASALTVPILLSSLGVKQYGFYLLVTGFGALLPFADLGLGVHLVSRVAQFRAAGDLNGIRRTIWNSFALLCLVGLALVLLLAGASYSLDVGSLIGAEDVPRRLVNETLLIFGVFYCAGIPLGLCQRLLIAIGRSQLANYWFACSMIGTLVATLGAASANVGVEWLAAIPAAVPTLGNAAALWAIFRRHPEFLPTRRIVAVSRIRSELSSSWLFAAVALADAVNFAIDPYIVSHFLSVSEVPEYSLATKMFAQPALVLSLTINFVWADFSSRWAAGELSGLRRRLKRLTVRCSAYGLLAAGALSVVADPVIAVWSHGEVAVSGGMIAVSACWCFFVACQAPLVMFLNAAHMGKFRASTSWLMAFANLALSIFFTPWLGVAGPILASLVANVFCVLVPGLVRADRALTERAGVGKPAKAEVSS